MHMDVKIKQDMDRQMALRENELYWRIYLLLNEGVPVVSKLVISRELGRHGSDLDFLLLQSKDQLKKTHRLNESEIEVLYPADGNTNIDKWNSNMFTSVILTIFRTSLLQNERKQIRDIHNILKELCINPDEYALDDETFDDHKTTLKDALSSLAFDKKVKSEIDDLINIYTNQPLNAADLLRHIEDINLSEETRQQLEIFLHSPPAIMGDSGDNTSDDVYEEESIGNVTSTNILDKGTQETPENFHSNDYDGDRQLSDAIDRENEVHADDDRYTVDTIYSRDTSEFHEEDAGEHSTASDDDAAKGSEEIDVGEHSTTSDDDVGKGSDEIVNEASKGMTEDEKKKCVLQWRKKDLQKCLDDKDFTSLAKSEMESWKNEHVHVAVLGRTGVGKSRFINAIRGCESPKESDYAPVGSVETTSTPKAYPHPRNNLLRLWDLPGIGTKTFPRNDYISNEKIGFYSYDIYIIMASDRFTEDEVYFAKKLDESRKVFIFVRSRVDVNLDGVDDIEAEVNKIRKDCEEIVKTSTVKSKDVYLISSKLVDHPYLDFPKLIERLVKRCSGLKKEAMMYSLQYSTKELINDKAGALESRLVWAGLKSAFGAAILVPDLSLTVDYRSISSEMEFYRKTLGITDSDLQDLAKKAGKTVDVLKHEYKLQTFDIFKITTKDVTKLGMQFAPYLKHISMSEALESTVKSLPVISSALGCGISFATAYCFLRSNLHLMVEDAITMLDILLKETGSEILYIN